MRILYHCRNALRKTCCKIHLIDKCLIIIMFILLLQSSYSLFSKPATTEMNSIDIIVRTTTASIFGYFLSSNFMRQETGASREKKEDRKTTTGHSKITDEYKDKSGLTGQESDAFRLAENKGVPSPGTVLTEPYRDSHLQIIVTTAIAVFCLIVLSVVRNFIDPEIVRVSASAEATISQFRDLISGCVGFLIGVPTTKR